MIKYKLLFKFLYNYEIASIYNCKRLILGSNAAFKYLIEDYPKLSQIINNKKIILYNGVEHINNKKNKINVRKKLNLENCFICVSVGRVEEVKGFDLLIDAMEELKKWKNIKMIIIGDGSELNNYKKIVENKKLSKYVLFLGRVENVEHFLVISDLYISPVRRAMFDLSLLEAMRAKLPIIASKIGGNIEAVKDSGILIDLNINDIIKSILSVYLDYNYKEQLRIKSYNNFIENFTIKKMCLNAADIYNKEIVS